MHRVFRCERLEVGGRQVNWRTGYPLALKASGQLIFATLLLLCDFVP